MTCKKRCADNHPNHRSHTSEDKKAAGTSGLPHTGKARGAYRLDIPQQKQGPHNGSAKRMISGGPAAKRRAQPCRRCGARRKTIIPIWLRRWLTKHQKMIKLVTPFVVLVGAILRIIFYFI
ncbi:hypothetical protein QEZ54_25330 [Catellatospora sp. KI3]|uniref:hypothetical protein n=1 Tax=Catellatospora sp. KI3 TaxID=3041620 RepID=UPI0024831659|nr:hypothetical protein [Catellatospora sp. KI3]MDI1464298.1 hypothetical protein [Catellatospora sp. KI3]